MSKLIANQISPRSGNDLTLNGNVTIGGTLTYEDVTNIDSVGLITARSGVRIVGGGLTVTGVSTFFNDAFVGTGVSIYGDAGIVSATSFYGDGSNLSNIVSGIELQESGSSKGTGITAVNFASGATVTTASGGISTVTVVATISTTASSPSANTVVTLDLSSAQHHELTLTAGITTITCSGGSFGDSHSVVMIQPSSGITTVGLSTYFLFPSGSSPTFSEGGSQVDLLSFVVKRVGAGGTQLLASAGLNYL